MDSRFRPLSLQRNPNPFPVDDTEKDYWRSFKKPVYIKEFLPVNSISYSPVYPYQLAVTNSNRVQLYSPQTAAILKTITVFKETVRCAKYRNDGQLLVASDDSGLIHVFDTSKKSHLRKISGHSKQVHNVCFTQDGLGIMSCSDDSIVKHWDLATGENMLSLKGHTDYVRCGLVTKTDPNIWMTGSYDHTVRLWDIRSNLCSMILDHGAPVESVLKFPSGGICLASGSNYITLWDIYSGRLLQKLSNHQKTITEMIFSEDVSKLLSCSLDGQVKVYDITNYTIIHSISYPAPLLCFALSPLQNQIVAGMSTGLLLIKTRQVPENEDSTSIAASRKKIIKRGSYRFFLRGKFLKPNKDEVTFIKIRKRTNLKKYDYYLRKFRYKKALDTALKMYTQNRQTVIVSLLKELSRRDGLIIAIGGRSSEELLPLMQFVARNIIHHKYSKTLIAICDLIIDLYGDTLTNDYKLYQELTKINGKVHTEISMHQILFSTLGTLDTILSVNTN